MRGLLLFRAVARPNRPGVPKALNAGTVAGCTSGSYASSQAQTAAVSVQVKLQSQTMEAGSSMPAYIIVDNRTGHAIHVKGCRGFSRSSLIAVATTPDQAGPSAFRH